MKSEIVDEMILRQFEIFLWCQDFYQWVEAIEKRYTHSTTIKQFLELSPFCHWEKWNYWSILDRALAWSTLTVKNSFVIKTSQKIARKTKTTRDAFASQNQTLHFLFSRTFAGLSRQKKLTDWINNLLQIKFTENNSEILPYNITKESLSAEIDENMRK